MGQLHLGGRHRNSKRRLAGIKEVFVTQNGAGMADTVPTEDQLGRDLRGAHAGKDPPRGRVGKEFLPRRKNGTPNGDLRYSYLAFVLPMLAKAVGTAKTVTVGGYDGEAALPDAARRHLTPSNAKTVYAVASGFLDGNERIETLVFPEGVTLGFFERGAVRDCPNLKAVRLGYTPHREVTALAATAAALSQIGRASCRERV